MPNLLLVTTTIDDFRELRQRFSRNGSTLVATSDPDNIIDDITTKKINLVLVDINKAGELSIDEPVWTQLREIKKAYRLPVVAILPGELIGRLESHYEITDFVTKPVNTGELEIRIKRALVQLTVGDKGEIIKYGDMVINRSTCEVTIGGTLVELTFKEYELLKLMAANKGKVFTREALLDEIWGMDYFGGDRTVDVHIRRLRSKIEDSEHSFIDTVRNIGYKFRNGK